MRSESYRSVVHGCVKPVEPLPFALDMHLILARQNDPYMIRLLEASTVAYTRAKSWEIFITFVLLFLAFAYPITYVFAKNPDVRLALFICSFVLTVLVQIYMDTFRGNTSKGAIFKEEFDVQLFGLPWKSTLQKPNPADVERLASAYKGKPIRDWYSTLLHPSIPHHVAVAILQHSNTSWDIVLRKAYRRLLILFLAVYSTALLSLILLKEVPPLGTFLLLFSVLAFYVHFISLIRAHSAVIRKRQAISLMLDGLIRGAEEIPTTTLRDIQDEIYTTRQEASKVPNFYFRLHQHRMNEVAEAYIESINQLYAEKGRGEGEG